MDLAHLKMQLEVTQMTYLAVDAQNAFRAYIQVCSQSPWVFFIWKFGSWIVVAVSMG